MSYKYYKRKILKETLRSLDSSYSIQSIDCSDCLYKDLGNGIDFEIEYGKGKFDIYVWKDKSRTIENIFYIKKSDLKEVLEGLIIKYGRTKN